MNKANEPPQRSPNATDEQHNEEEETDYESAIEACTYGRFHIMLLVLCTPITAATIFETTTMSYVFPAAECDLKLSLMDKGLVNGITYAGMIISAIPWGFIADTMGRKYTLICGLLLEFVCVVGAATTQNLTQLMISKFIGGLVSCGPFAIIMSYLSEFHSRKQRARVMMATGMIKNANIMLLPALAVALLPLRFHYTFLGLEFYNWNLFIFVTGLPSLFSGIMLFFLPESPKFLMSQGRNAEALEVFQRIYAINTRQDRQQYPVKHLFDEAPEKSARKMEHAAGISQNRTLKEKRKIAVESFTDGLKQLKPLCSNPYLQLSLLVYIMHFGILMGQNTIRLWLPQIFVSMEEYEQYQIGVPSMCDILEYNVNKTRTIQLSEPTTEECVVHVTTASYINNVIAAASAFFGSMVASGLVNKVGNKMILCFGLAISSLLCSSYYFSTNSMTTLIISSVFVTFASVSITSVISASVNIFPTAMRTMVVVLVMTTGRLGSMLGNVFFPITIKMGCLPPFMMLSSVMFIAFIISLFLPETNKYALK